MVRVFGLMIDRYQPHSVSVYHDGKLMREWYMDTAHDAQQFATTLYAAHQLLSQEPTEILVDGREYVYREGD